jgi:hypothetical protein
MPELDQRTIERIYDKLDEVVANQASIHTALDVHVASEQGWQKAITEKLDNHVDEHRAASNVWRKGVVGAFFAVIGTLVVWVASFIWQHVGKV